MNAPVPAELALSQALPMSPLASLACTVTASTTDAGRAASTLSTKADEKSPAYLTTTLLPSALTIVSIFSGVQPSWVSRKAGDLLSTTTRFQE